MEKREGDQPERQQPAAEKKSERKEEEKLEGIPLDSSPYVDYKDLEDYKDKAYGAQGHLQPKPGRGGGGPTDAPTLSGDAASSVINRQGVP